MGQEGTKESARKHEADEETYELVDLLDLVEQLETEKQRNPQAALQLIQMLEQVLGRFQPVEYPLFYAAIHNYLGVAYWALSAADPTTNLERAIACYQEALRFRTPETAPLDYATTQHNLGRAYYDLPAGDRTANLER